MSTHFRSLVTGEVIAREELEGCGLCEGTGEVALLPGTNVDVIEACQWCNGTGLLEGYGIHGDSYAPRRVVAVRGPLMEESAS